MSGKLNSLSAVALAIALAAGSVVAQTGGSQGTQDTASQGSQAAQGGTKSTQAAGKTGGGQMFRVLPGLDQEISGANREQVRLAREVRHELALLPRYTLFDDLTYRVDGDSVTLGGFVNNSALKSDAERVVKRIEGVEQVVNNIEVLPPSTQDDRIRRAVARSIFGFSNLSRYGWAAAPSIHIIVNGGRVTLEGVVDNQADKNTVGIQARQVPGIFEVTNNLQVAGGGAK